MSQSDFSDGSRIIEQSGTSYTIEGFCHRKMVTFNNASAVAVSIADPATLGNGFRCTIENLGAGLVTLTPASGTVDGATSLALSQNQGIALWSDGTNLFTERGMGTGSGNFAAGGDLSGTSSSQTVIGLEGKALDSATVGSPSDGDVIKYDSASGKYVAGAVSGGSGSTGTENGGYSASDEIPGSPDTMDDEFNGSSLDAKWSWTNQGTSTATESKGVLAMAHPTHSGDDLSYISQPTPSTPWEFTTKVTHFSMSPAGAFYQYGGLMLGDGSGKIISAILVNQYGFRADYWNSPTSYNSAKLSYGNLLFQRTPLYIRISNDGTNLKFYLSQDGIAFDLILTLSATDFFASGPSLVGLIVGNKNTTYPATVNFDWFRRTT